MWMERFVIIAIHLAGEPFEPWVTHGYNPTWADWGIMAGSFGWFYRRNHMKNQPKLPAMMPQSAHVGLYPCVTQGSNGPPARWVAMRTKRSIHLPTCTKTE